MKNLFLAVLFLTGFIFVSQAQEAKQYKAGCIVFYNIENLFDTIPGRNDKEFAPYSKKK
ncbi:MAG: hypothetical protein PHE56_16585 [Bacteroidales bacterium]|nr:hypothetical protein [Bacteroidales bacterium]